VASSFEFIEWNEVWGVAPVWRVGPAVSGRAGVEGDCVRTRGEPSMGAQLGIDVLVVVRAAGARPGHRKRTWPQSQWW
jgi:hypothetical protein